MRSPYLFVPLLLSGCLEGEVALFGCPPDEVCSDDAPDGLLFIGADLAGVFDLSPNQTAVGGIQHVRLVQKVRENTFVDLATDYEARGGAALEVEGTDGAIVTVRGAATGTNHLEIRDGDGALLDRKLYTVDEVARVTTVADLTEKTDLPIAYLAGTVRIGVALSSASGDRLVDEDMTIELAGSSREKWDVIEMPDVAAGTLSFSVAAAGQPATIVEATVLSSVGALVDHPPVGGFVVGIPAFVCFDAVSEGHHVANLRWTFSGTNTARPSTLFQNCAFASPELAGEITFTATAGGLTTTVTYPVAARSAKPSWMPREEIEGERAALIGAASR